MGAINPRDKRRERQIVIALQDRIADKLQKDLGRVLSKTYKDAGNGYGRGGLQGVDSAINRNTEALARALTISITATTQAFINRTVESAKELKGDDYVTKAEKSGFRERVNNAVLSFIRRHIAKRVTQVNETTKEHIRRLVDRGRDSELTPDDIARGIADIADTLAGPRAHVIARTETHTAANEAALQSARELEVELKKEWVSSMDDRVRDDHRDANGQVVAMDEDFIVGGEGLKYPGDPSGSAENVIMCRCAQVFVTND